MTNHTGTVGVGRYTATGQKVTQGVDLTVFAVRLEWTHGIFGTHEQFDAVITVRSDDETKVIDSTGHVEEFEDLFARDEDAAGAIEELLFNLA